MYGTGVGTIEIKSANNLYGTHVVEKAGAGQKVSNPSRNENSQQHPGNKRAPESTQNTPTLPAARIAKTNPLPPSYRTVFQHIPPAPQILKPPVLERLTET